jgi:hypothetical protein
MPVLSVGFVVVVSDHLLRGSEKASKRRYGRTDAADFSHTREISYSHAPAAALILRDTKSPRKWSLRVVA